MTEVSSLNFVLSLNEKKKLGEMKCREYIEKEEKEEEGVENLMLISHFELLLLLF